VPGATGAEVGTVARTAPYPSLRAVTRTVRFLPTRAGTGVRVGAVAAGIGSPFANHR
jgi:hypothetical protein